MLILYEHIQSEYLQLGAVGLAGQFPCPKRDELKCIFKIYFIHLIVCLRTLYLVWRRLAWWAKRCLPWGPDVWYGCGAGNWGLGTSAGRRMQSVALSAACPALPWWSLAPHRHSTLSASAQQTFLSKYTLTFNTRWAISNLTLSVTQH